ncbi:hypothetical protein IMZ31_19190 (plasmid) [Pontibacillus sp. ALD_SL1]|uniref:hypothetical protein n=1 Tax=Pontibacillus sp. ALD_SL1 TaxID=2777185 RepID=UPI001A962378|nr:hypothetical protein [Pontibacillus sp. ALD_SL1]QST02676.1 hypothetical protein IMZ31_19190 [Pontibacillus sp. ALD_SL1]
MNEYEMSREEMEQAMREFAEKRGLVLHDVHFDTEFREVSSGTGGSRLKSVVTGATVVATKKE